jgi:hypothetical protein
MAITFFNDAVTNTPVDVPNSSQRIRWAHLINTGGGAAYLQIFAKKASDVVLGTTVPDWVIRVQPAPNEDLPLLFPEDAPQVADSALTGVHGLSIAATSTPTGAGAATISVGLITG